MSARVALGAPGSRDLYRRVARVTGRSRWARGMRAVVTSVARPATARVANPTVKITATDRLTCH